MNSPSQSDSFTPATSAALRAFLSARSAARFAAFCRSSRVGILDFSAGPVVAPPDDSASFRLHVESQ